MFDAENQPSEGSETPDQKRKEIIEKPLTPIEQRVNYASFDLVAMIVQQTPGCQVPQSFCLSRLLESHILYF